MKVLVMILGLAFFSQAFAAATFNCGSKARLEFFDNGTVKVTGQRPMPKTPQLRHSAERGLYYLPMTMELRLRNFDFTVPVQNIYDNSVARLWSYDAREMDGTYVFFQQKRGKSTLEYVHKFNAVRVECKRDDFLIPVSAPVVL